MEKKKLIVYEVQGKRFNTHQEARRYAIICNSINLIMDKLQPRTKEVEEGLAYLEHDPLLVRIVLRKFLLYCRRFMPSFASWFVQVADGKRHISHIQRVLSDYESDYPILYKSLFRFMCINIKSGHEFQQPYFALHPEEGYKAIEKRIKYLQEHEGL